MKDSAVPRLKKSDRTRAAILDAAKSAFATSGYERTTIRDIAAAAHIDPAMVMRYFGSKDELFARVSAFDLALPDVAALPRDAVGHALARHLLKVWEGEGASAGFPVLLRSAASNSFAADRMREILSAQLLPAVSAVAPDRPALRTGLLASQVLGLALSRYVLQLPPATALTHEEIIANIGPTLQRYAVEPLPG